MLSRMVEIDDMDGLGEVRFGDSSDPLGSIPENNNGLGIH